jgi:hypothetical protein
MRLSTWMGEMRAARAPFIGHAEKRGTEEGIRIGATKVVPLKFLHFSEGG